MLDQGLLEGGVLAEEQPVGPCPPGSMTGKAGFRQNHHQPWPIFWTRADDARLVGKLLHWRDPADRICSEGAYHLIERRRLGEDSPFAQLLVPEAKTLPGAWTSISSNWNDGANYYHWMLDGLTRLAIREVLPEKTRILLPSHVPRFASETLALLGLDSEPQAADHPCIHPERFYFCSPSAMTGVWNPHGYQWLRKSFSPYFGLTWSGPPVFLTRRGGARIPDNIDIIESIFHARGFDILDCGTITVREQIHKISSAPAVAGLHGAAMTNLLWAAPGTPSLEIFQPNYLNGCYEQMAFHGSLSYTGLVIKAPEGLDQIISWCEEHTVPKSGSSIAR